MNPPAEPGVYRRVRDRPGIPELPASDLLNNLPNCDPHIRESVYYIEYLNIAILFQHKHPAFRLFPAPRTHIALGSGGALVELGECEAMTGYRQYFHWPGRTVIDFHNTDIFRVIY